MSLASSYAAEFTRARALLGVPGSFGRAKDAPGTPGIPVRFIMRHPGLRDEAIVNSYGVNAQVISLPPLPEFLALPPEKFDFVDEAGPNGATVRYVFDAVFPKQIAGVVVAFTAFCKGKGA